MMEIVRELKTPALVQQSANQAMKSLNEMAKHQSVPMSEFVKVLIWEKDNLCTLFNEDIEREKMHGTKFENHTWCGVPYHEFEIPSLHIYKQ